MGTSQEQFLNYKGYKYWIDVEVSRSYFLKTCLDLRDLFADQSILLIARSKRFSYKPIGRVKEEAANLRIKAILGRSYERREYG